MGWRKFWAQIIGVAANLAALWLVLDHYSAATAAVTAAASSGAVGLTVPVIPWAQVGIALGGVSLPVASFHLANAAVHRGRAQSPSGDSTP